MHIYIYAYCYSKTISKRLTSMPCNKNVLHTNADIYQTALKNSGFDGTVRYNNQSEQANNVNIEKQIKLENVSVLFFGTTHLIL